MASNKNATIRYKALDKCFSNQYKKFFIGDLIKYCNEVLSAHFGEVTDVSRRQIFDDINFMRSDAGFEAPIVSFKDGKRAYYRYEDLTFSIYNKPLTTSEETQLIETLEMLSRIKGMPGMDWIETVQTRVFAGLDLNHKQRQVVDFEENQYLKGLVFLTPLYQYIVNRQCLTIGYRSFKSETENQFTISPNYLKQYNNRWFLFGLNHQLNILQNLALDRITSLLPIVNSYIDSNINFEEYFEDIIGVTNIDFQPVEEIVIELSDNIIPYVLSKPIHGSQILKGNILKLKLKHNYELESLIMSYGENMKVLSPKELIEIISERVKKVYCFYESKIET